MWQTTFRAVEKKNQWSHSVSTKSTKGTHARRPRWQQAPVTYCRVTNVPNVVAKTNNTHSFVIIFSHGPGVVQAQLYTSQFLTYIWHQMMADAGIILKVSPLARLAFKAGCCWDLSWAGAPASGLLVWPGLLYSMVAVFQGGVFQERARRMRCCLMTLSQMSHKNTSTAVTEAKVTEVSLYSRGDDLDSTLWREACQEICKYL